MVDQTLALQVNPGFKDPIDQFSKLTQIQHTRQQMEVNEYNLRSEQLARAANEVAQYPEGSPERTAAWNHHIDDLHKRGYLNNVERQQWYGKPSTLAINAAIARGTPVKTEMEQSGKTAGLNAAATAPYQFHQIDPNNPAGYYGAQPGAPTQTNTYGRPALGYRGQPGPVPGAAPNGVPNPATMAGRPGGPPMVPAQPNAPNQPNPNNMQSTPRVIGEVEGQASGLYPKPGESPDAGPSPNARVAGSLGPAGAADAGKGKPTGDKYYDDAPVTQVAAPFRTGPGVMNQGVPPAVREAASEALKQFQGDIEPSAQAAVKTKASLGTMKAILDKGNVQTDRLGEIRLGVAGFINAVLGEKDGATARSILGDLPSTEVLNKETTRMGLNFARQTEGAREAVQAIRIALGANPSIMNSVEGNKKIIGIMTAASDYDMERAKAAKAYYQKQLDNTGFGTLKGFDTWFADHYSPATFISKAVPYALPQDGQLQNGVTYEWPKRGEDGHPKVNPKTKQPEMNKGVYNAKNNTFVY